MESVVTKVTQFHFYCFAENVGEIKVNQEDFYSWDKELLGGFVAYGNPEEYVLQKEQEKVLETIRNLSFVGVKNPNEARNKLINFLYTEGIVSKPYESFKKKVDENHEVRVVYGVKTVNDRPLSVYKTRLEATKQNPGKEIAVGFSVVDTTTNTISQGCNMWNDTISEAVSAFGGTSKGNSLKRFEKSRFERKPQEKAKQQETKPVEQLSVKNTVSVTKSTSKKLDSASMIGMRFGNLRVIGLGKKPYHLLCECECGTVKEIYKYNLIKEKFPTRSCGCHENKSDINRLFNTCFGLIEPHALRSDNTSGRTGVLFSMQRQKYRAYIGAQGKLIDLGFYETFNEAVRARDEGEKIYHLPLIEAKKMMQKKGKLEV